MSNKDNMRGLSEAEILQQRHDHGDNLITPPKQTHWVILYLEKFKDPIIVILLIAALITLSFGVVHNDYTESVGIIVAIMLATGVGFWQEYSAKRKFDQMQQNRDYEPVTVRRDGVVQTVSKDQLVKGDVVILSVGDEIPADIILHKALDMRLSEASMTGESRAVSKCTRAEYVSEHGVLYMGAGFAPYLLLRGTVIEQGDGEGIVEAVGDRTEIGRTTQEATVETDRKTPLEIQLDGLADKITRGAFGVAILMFTILNIVHWTQAGASWADIWSYQTVLLELRYLMAAVVVVIVAVPEGLPLAVTLALAFSMKTMAREKNLIKKMHACETIGAVQVIFTDKTGTLTENRMRVVETDVAPGQEGHLELIGALNATAHWAKGDKILGNPTEGAILTSIGRKQCEQLQRRYSTVNSIPFSSQYKYMVVSVLDKETQRELVLIKGAPEVLAELIRDNQFLGKVSEQQERGRRAISGLLIDSMSFDAVEKVLQNRQLEKLRLEKQRLEKLRLEKLRLEDQRLKKQRLEDLRLEDQRLEKQQLEKYRLEQARYIGTWFIEDGVRANVPDAIDRCRNAGIRVVMLTGDNLATAKEIAHQAKMPDLWAIEAKDFDAAIEKGNPRREFPNVIARCTPIDKLKILKWVQERGHVCGMTGDGVNDSPALNHADVGIAMGSGTDIAKEAADIILLDDAFPSIVTGVKWGRSLFNNIKKFLFFQLTINVSACLIALFGPLVGVELPFTVTQFLWINLVMDSLAAIALASEPADEKVLLDPPRRSVEQIIDRRLAKRIFGFGIFVWLLSSLLLWLSQLESFSFITPTIFFAGYMMLNWWNLFNARVIGQKRSLFDGFCSNPKFYLTALVILATTIAIVQLGGEVFRTEPLSLLTWVIIIIVTSFVAILRQLYYYHRSRRKKNIPANSL